MVKEFIYKSHNANYTKQIAKFFAKNFISKYGKNIIFLKGDLGSGKTTFVRYCLNYLGIDDENFEGSPTFTIVNEYDNDIIHMDLYRLKNQSEIEYSGILDYFNKDNGIFFIEWPELLNMKPSFELTFTILNDTSRKINVCRC